jgi:hypothetical protein
MDEEAEKKETGALPGSVPVFKNSFPKWKHNNLTVDSQFPSPLTLP